MRKSNLTYEELIELAPKDRPFQIKVEESIFWCFSDGYELDVRCGYHTNGYWEDIYKGTFTLIDEYRNMYEKPEVLEVGTEVEILESGKVVKTGKIHWVYRFDSGIEALHYDVKLNNKNNVGTFPHYCVRPVEKVEEKEEVKTAFDDMFGDMIEEFERLCDKAQDIINKYKK